MEICLWQRGEAVGRQGRGGDGQALPGPALRVTLDEHGQTNTMDTDLGHRWHLTQPGGGYDKGSWSGEVEPGWDNCLGRSSELWDVLLYFRETGEQV